MSVFIRVCAVALSLALAVPAALGAQGAESEADRSTTVLAGVGHSFGWLGGNVSVYLLERWSAYAGLGYTPEVEAGHPTGVTWAVGARLYRHSPPHQLFLGLGYAQIFTVSVAAPDAEGTREYGPTVTGGYQYTAGSGFTFLGGLGLGYAVGSDLDAPFSVSVDLGVGYTW